MGHRSLKPASKVMYINGVTIRGKLVVAASGAVTSWNGYGIASVTKESGDGQYTFVFSDTWNKLVGFNGSVMNASAAGLSVELLSEDVDNTTTPVCVVQVGTAGDGTAADIASGGTLFLEWHLMNSARPVGNTVT